MLSPQVEILGDTLEKAYGLGMALGYDGGVMRIQHMGGCPWGSNSWLIAYPETGQGAVVMTNSVGGSTIRAEIVLSIAIEYGWPLVAGIER
jgi:CubicO group peptidase (beta-lactamase class C family)